MFLHIHPYEPFIKQNTEKLIVGTLPPPRFSTGDLLDRDVDFSYGSCHNSLWLYIDKIHDLNLRYDNTKEAVLQRKRFLESQKIGICDIVESCERQSADASDLGMKNIVLRDLIKYLRKYQNVHTLLFIGGNSKNGPEYFFRKLIRSKGIKLKLLKKQTPRINEFCLNDRVIKTVSLTSSSGAANISIASKAEFKAIRKLDPGFTPFDFRVLQYREYI